MPVPAVGFTRPNPSDFPRYALLTVLILYPGGYRMPVADNYTFSIERPAISMPIGRIPISPANGDGASPLIWWRTRTPSEFEPNDANIIRHALKGTTITAEPCWPGATTNQITTAIRVAVALLKTRHPADPEIDLALSALLAFAVDGDVTAGILISSALRRRSHVDPPCRVLGDLWLIADL